MAKHLDSVASRSNRREFVRAGIGLGVAGAAGFGMVDQLRAAENANSTKPSEPLFRSGDTIVFQGDSITDAGRKRDVASKANSEAALGRGYAWLTAAQLLVDHADADLIIYNRGISGNKVYQLAERWQADCLDLKPNVLSILIGVNDFWHTLDGKYDGTAEKYESDYRALVKRTRDALPDVKLVICEPFVLRTGHVNDSWFPKFDDYRAAARRLADEAGAAFVEFQAMFDRASKIAPPQQWAGDGVHPTGDGATLMADWWLKKVEG